VSCQRDVRNPDIAMGSTVLSAGIHSSDHLGLSPIRARCRIDRARVNNVRRGHHEQGSQHWPTLLAGAALGARLYRPFTPRRTPVYQITKSNFWTEPPMRGTTSKSSGRDTRSGGSSLRQVLLSRNEGDPRRHRYHQQWDSVEKINAYRNSAAFKELLPLRDKLAKFRSFTVEAVPIDRSVLQKPEGRRGWRLPATGERYELPRRKFLRRAAAAAPK